LHVSSIRQAIVVASVSGPEHAEVPFGALPQDLQESFIDFSLSRSCLQTIASLLLPRDVSSGIVPVSVFGDNFYAFPHFPLSFACLVVRPA